MISESERGERAAPKAVSESFCSSLSQGLHAAAQPLTILRASLGKSQIDRMSKGELRELATSSAVEVERVCTLFSCLERLVIAESIEPQLSATPILPLLAYATDGVSLLFVKDGVFLNSMVSETCELVLINRIRTLEALSSVLLIAHALSRAGEIVELIATSSNFVEIVVRNVKLSVDSMSAEMSLNMALAEANIRSQQASFTWSLQPFSVQIELQKAPFSHSC